MGKQRRLSFEETTYQRLQSKMVEQAEISPQNLGLLTSAFKYFSPLIKYSPWRIFVPIAILFSVIGLLFFGSRMVRLVSILQRGF